MYEEVSDFEEYEVEDGKLAKYRKWFKGAVESWEKWRAEALEDYNFVTGKQWTDEELAEFAEQKRPALVINRIKPLVNILCGWQKTNRFDIAFLPRTADDMKLCEIRSGVTKYVFDKCDYETQESYVFRDCSIGGLGWFHVKYDYDYEIENGKIIVERTDPFSVYVDPESHELDFSDAKFVCCAKWADKDELIQIYPDKAEAIENNYSLYDPIEKESNDKVYVDPMWYNSELKKVRVIECWYKEHSTQTFFYTADGQKIPYTEETQEQINLLISQNTVANYQDIPVTKIRCCTFFDKTLLEDIESPYQHGQFPYIPMVYHYYGCGDTPAGFVRSLKDPQKELNKRRMQTLHILNTTANGGGFAEEGAMSPEQFEEFEKKNNIPGHFNKVMPGGISKILEREPKAPPAGIIQAEQQATSDLISISGINENLLGTDIPSGSSGRAIELKQKQAVTHLSVIFDALRTAKKKLAFILWGSTGRKGLIPQFYTAEKIYRIESENGQQFVPVNQQVAMQDPLAGVVMQTVNDLSVGDFDIVVSDVESSTTQRRAQALMFTDAASKLGLPPQVAMQPMLELYDIPKRDEILAQYQQMQQQQAQMQQQEMQMKLRIEEIKNQDSRQIITYKDSPLPIQLAMAAKAGLIDPAMAQYAMQLWTQQMFPQFAQQQAQMQQQQMIQQQMQGQPPPQMQNQQPPPQIPQQQVMADIPRDPQQIANQQRPKAMTNSAVQSALAGMSPMM